MGSTSSATCTRSSIDYLAIFMATGTACRSIGGFVARFLITHEMCCMDYETVVPIVGANNFDVAAIVKKGTAGGANVGRGGYSVGFGCCRTFHPSSATEG